MKKSSGTGLAGIGLVVLVVLGMFGYNTDFVTELLDTTPESSYVQVEDNIVDTEQTPESENNFTNYEILDINEIPEYDGQTKVIEINNNESTLTVNYTEAFMEISDLDEFNRVGRGTAFITPNSYHGSSNRSEESNISNIKPTGWKNKKIDKGWLYNRSHVIGYAFFGTKTDTIQNLFTGTQDFNQSREYGMLKYETMVQDKVKNDNQSVSYEVTPLFKDEELLARGVQMQAKSVDGTLDFNVFIYNVQDGYTIDYSDGTSVKN